MEKYRAAIVGLGRIAWTLEDDVKRDHPCTHAGALAQLEDVELVAGASRGEQSAKAFQERFHTRKAYTNYLEMVREEKIDIVGVCTNPETHAQIVVDLANAGVKGILCEKPIALSLEDCDRMLKACQANGTILMTMHNRRFNALYRSAKALIQRGEIGDINAVIGICEGCKPNKNWQSEFEGPLLHDATHLFDIMRYLLGDVEWVLSDVERAKPTDRVEDAAYSIMRFRNGVYGTTLVNERTDYMRFELEVQGSKGKMLLYTNEAYLWKYEDSKYASHFKELVQVPYPKATAKLYAYVEAYRELIGCMRAGRQSPTSSGLDGRAALEMIMAIYESKRRGCQRVYMPLPGEPSSLVRGIEENAF
ncbi:MAG: Gfo/Idh/MocA family oxidoreductase [Eubacteriales bacterium]|nr:Gfo/Idh/MocA family oxidoreductase [Eubacteriales bacterium]